MQIKSKIIEIMAISSNQVSALLTSLAGRIRQARINANLTQRALAEKTGISIKTISNAEDSGQVSLDTLTRLLYALGRLEDLQRVLEDPGPSPIELARRSGKRRQRVRHPEPASDAAGDEWQW